MCASPALVLRNRPARLALALLITSTSLLLPPPASAAKKASGSYVVYLGGHSHGREGAALAANRERARRSHYALLRSVLRSDEKARDAIFYSYTRYINGFAATLEEDDAAEISSTFMFVVFSAVVRCGFVEVMCSGFGTEHPSVVSVFPNRGHRLHTTRSWEFLGMEKDGRVRPAPSGPKPSSAKASSSATWTPHVGAVEEKMVELEKLIYWLFGAKQTRLASRVQIRGQARDWSSKHLPLYHGCYRSTAVARHWVCAVPVRVWPEAGSFSDDGMGPAPAGWRGICQDQQASDDAQVRCNRSVPLPPLSSPCLSLFLCLHPSMSSSMALWLGHCAGQSLSPVRLSGDKYYPLISSVEAKAANATANQAKLCIERSLDKAKVKGRIVVCIRGKNARVEKGEEVRRAGGVGLVLANDEASGNEMIADAHVLPATHITYSDGLILSASAYITVPTTAVDTKPAPFMAAFSSQGPNPVTPQILKDNMKKPMSNSSFLRATPFGYGAGHVRPNRAADPGLVYDANATDYLGFLCALGYNSSTIAAFMAGAGPRQQRACPAARAPLPEDLNYPSVAVPHLSPTGAERAVTRRVRNVGAGPAAYVARVAAPRGVAVEVRPARLEFAAPGEEREFTVAFRARKGFFLPGEYVFGRLVWTDGDGGHRVGALLW
ncbi:hypothetical protein EJB05_43454, partial [Eragrostis curvula]